MKLLKRLFAILAVAFVTAIAVFPRAVTAKAASVVDFSKTAIEDDLADLDAESYLPNASGVPQVIRFQEYCYSTKYFFSQYYGLYVYVFNPTGQAIDKNSERNVVNIATSYNADGTPANYDNVRLIYCDHTDTELFYKFQIDSGSEFLKGAKTYASLHEGKRRYDVAGVQLITENGVTKDDTVSSTYIFEGFAKGCADSTESESTLTCSREGLETIQLDVQHTNYRPDNFNRRCDEVNSVYFSVPNDYFDKYGGLQKIKAEWWEYRTKQIFVTSSEEAYKALDQWVGVNIGEKNEDLSWRIAWDDQIDGLANGHYFNGVYNKLAEQQTHIPNVYYFGGEPTPVIDWLLLREGVDSVEDYYVSSGEMIEYMEEYTLRFPEQEKILGKYAEGLYEDRIDEDRLQYLVDPAEGRGHVVQEIEANTEFDLVYEADKGLWEQVYTKDFSNKTETVGTYQPIVVLEAEDLYGHNAQTFAAEYLIDDTDAQSVLNYCREATSNGEKAVLFRFAVTDYVATTAYFDNTETWTIDAANGYVAQKTDFLDFDVISLTFRDEGGEDTVIACVSNPMDIINGVSPAPDLDVNKGIDYDELWEGLMMILSFAVGIPLVIFAVVLLIKGVWELLKLLFWGRKNE